MGSRGGGGVACLGVGVRGAGGGGGEGGAGGVASRSEVSLTPSTKSSVGSDGIMMSTEDRTMNSLVTYIYYFTIYE